MLKLQIFVLAIICSKSFSGHAMCSTKKRTLLLGKTAYYMEHFCCRNFEKKNGNCFECQDGFTTSNGEPCKPCKENKFGNKCAHTCRCIEDERCDSRHGCVPLHSGISTEKLSTLMYDSLQTTSSMNLSEHIMNTVYNESSHTQTYDYENKTYSTDGDGEHANDSHYINYVIWTGCILFIIVIVVSSSICYTLNTNLLLKHSANIKSAQAKGTVAAVVNRSKNAPGPCDTINQQTMYLDHDMEIQVVTKEAVVKIRN